jgi:O-antigen/teichoic acid export membrane protein
MSAVERSPGATLLRGGFAGVATLTLERGAALLLVVVLARWLPAEAYGRYSFVVAYLTIFQILADLGLEPVLLRRLSQDPARRSDLLASALSLRACLAALAGLGAVALVPWVAEQGDLRPLVIAAAPAVLWSAQPGYRALLRAEMRLDEVLRIAALGAGATLLGAALAIASGGGVAAVFACVATAQLATFGLAAVRARDLFRPHLRFDPATWRGLLHESWPVGLNVLVAVAGLRIAPILLMRYRGSFEVGAFASAARLAEALNLVADGVLLAVFPMLARLAPRADEDRRAMADLAAIAARYLGLVFLAIALFLSQAAEPLMRALFGETFAPAAPVLAVLAWNAVLSALGTLYANLLVVVGRQRVLLLLNSVSAVAQVGLQVVLVSRFGLLGAACGVLVAAAANHLVLASLPTTAADLRPCFRAVLGPMIAAALLFALAPALPFGALGRAIVLPLALAAPLLVRHLAADRAKLHDLLAARPAASGADDGVVTS